MPFVYRYKDMLSDTYKYIGIVKANGVPSLQRRIMEHERDAWFTTSKWYIDYMTTANVAEAEAIESHLISLYHAEFNKAKANWGTCSFIDIDDTLFVPFSTIDPREKFRKEIHKLQGRIETLKRMEKEAQEQWINTTIIQSRTISILATDIADYMQMQANRLWDFSIGVNPKSQINWTYLALQWEKSKAAFEHAVRQITIERYCTSSKMYKEDKKTEEEVKRARAFPPLNLGEKETPEC